MRQILTHDDGGIIDTKQADFQIDQHAIHELDVQGVGQGFELRIALGLFHPPQVAAVVDIAFDGIDLAGQVFQLRAGDDQHGCIRRDDQRVRQVQATNLEAFALQCFEKGTQVRIGASQWITFTMPGDKHDLALGVAQQALQGIGQVFFGKIGDVLGATLVLHDHFTIGTNTKLACLVRVSHWINKAQL